MSSLTGGTLTSHRCSPSSTAQGESIRRVGEFTPDIVSRLNPFRNCVLPIVVVTCVAALSATDAAAPMTSDGDVGRERPPAAAPVPDDRCIMIDPIAPDTGQCVVRGVDNDVGRFYLVKKNPSVCRPPSSDVLDAEERSNASLDEQTVRNNPPSTRSASSTR